MRLLESVRRIPVALLLAVTLMVAASGASVWLQPHRMLADEWAPLDLAQVMPARFGEWTQDPAALQVVTDPTIEATLKQFYSQTLNRAYVNRQGQRVMLSLAYGKNQNSFNTAAHRPEFCYSGQGFTVEAKGVQTLGLREHTIQAVRLVGSKPGRHEPITYWVTLADTAAVPGLSRKIQQIRYGLQGLIVDGMLVRLSSLGEDDAREFALHAAFARDWEAALPAAMRPRFFGH